MCTPDEVKQQVYAAFEEEGGLRHQMLEDVEAANNRTLIKILGVYGITIVTAVIGFTIYITNIENRVGNIEEISGFTQQEAEVLRFQIQANQQAINESASSQEVRELKEAFIRLDERLRNKGI